MDPENIGKETIIKVTDWLRGIWKMRRRASPVQQWVDSIPTPTKSNTPCSMDQTQDMCNRSTSPVLVTPAKDVPISKRSQLRTPNMTVSAPINVPGSPAMSTPGIPSSVPYNRLVRDPSFQSDSSHCSSVESLLELRKADPEEILFSLGFGGCPNSPQEHGPLSRIPKRFLQPSKLKGIAINDFVKHQQETCESIDSVSLGYRGLTGSPYVAPSEIVQKIMERLREHESHEMDSYAMYNTYDQYSPIFHNGRQSVLSPDNRQFLEQPRSKSPDMRNKRMIIGQKSFAFGCNGDLIEISPEDTNKSPDSKSNNYSDMDDPNANIEETNSRSEPKLDKMFERKKLSFDDSIGSSETDSKSESEEDKRSKLALTSAWNDNQNYVKYNDSRRASEGFSDIKPLRNVTRSERRFSDGMIVKNQGNESSLLKRRRSLKRQLRISETDPSQFCDAHVSDYNESQNLESQPQLQYKTCESPEKATNIEQSRVLHNTDTLEFAEGTECRTSSIDTSDIICASSDICDCSSKAGRNRPNEDDLISCCSEQSKHSCTSEDNQVGCCCRTNEAQCWKKVEKIMEENKKLEDVVRRSRIEMAEIRDMLNSVLSVRLEPGF